MVSVFDIDNVINFINTRSYLMRDPRSAPPPRHARAKSDRTWMLGEE
jgi:hypothetical protein